MNIQSCILPVSPFPLLLLARFFHPSQGDFFIFVYCRPYVKSIRAQNAELTWLQAFWIAFKGGGDNEDCTRPSYDYGMVMDKDGIDVPRLPEAERQRKQEIVRQKFKRKSVTYKPISLPLSNSKIAEDVEGLDLMLVLGCDSDEQVTEIEEGFGRIQAIDFREKGLGPCDETKEKKKQKLEPLTEEFMHKDIHVAILPASLTFNQFQILLFIVHNIPYRNIEITKLIFTIRISIICILLHLFFNTMFQV